MHGIPVVIRPLEREGEEGPGVWRRVSAPEVEDFRVEQEHVPRFQQRVHRCCFPRRRRVRRVLIRTSMLALGPDPHYGRIGS
eukprot:2010036-Rhodomonas_salina.2